MLTSKQRAYLKGLANSLDTIFQVGKAGITPELTKSIDDALEARELIKANVLDNNMLGIRETAQTLAERTHSDVVQVIGNRFVLYRPSKKKPVIVLPETKKR